MTATQLNDALRAVPAPAPHHPTATERALLNALWAFIDAMGPPRRRGGSPLDAAHTQAMAAVGSFEGGK